MDTMKNEMLQSIVNCMKQSEAYDKKFCSPEEIAEYGEWEPGNPVCPVCGESKFKGLDADIWADWQPPFCPNCGARMVGGGER